MSKLTRRSLLKTLPIGLLASQFTKDMQKTQSIPLKRTVAQPDSSFSFSDATEVFSTPISLLAGRPGTGKTLTALGIAALQKAAVS